MKTYDGGKRPIWFKMMQESPLNPERSVENETSRRSYSDDIMSFLRCDGAVSTFPSRRCHELSKRRSAVSSAPCTLHIGRVLEVDRDRGSAADTENRKLQALIANLQKENVQLKQKQVLSDSTNRTY